MVRNKTAVTQEYTNTPVSQDFFCLFVAVNAKYVHTNLAVRYLSKNCSYKSEIAEYSINDDVFAICADIYRKGIKTVLFSCYIWNITTVLSICSLLKKADEKIVICLGGPEVSFRAESLLAENDFIDYIVCGEGESITNELIERLQSGNADRQIFKNDEAEDLNKLTFPYENEDLSLLKDRIIYYETQRGCPFSCSFCLSGGNSKVRYLATERVKKELDFFIKSGVPLVKLTDRTFNSNPERALQLIEFIKSNNEKTTFHFEIKAEIMTDELTESLKTAPRGMFQIEIGVQSTDAKTLKKIKRVSDIKKISEIVAALRENDNIHLHLDLIAGLPGEDLESFITSFNETFAMKPHDLQLGFLKKLYGADIKDENGRFSDFPPYEVISSDKMTYDEILMLKSTSFVLERYYNSGSFRETIEYITTKYFKTNPFEFFKSLGDYFEQNKIGAASKKTLFETLKAYCAERFGDEEITYCLAKDWCSFYRDNLSFTDSGDDLKQRAFDFLKNEENIKKFFAHHEDKKPTKLYKQLRFSEIGGRIYVFDYLISKYYDITGLI